MSGLASRRPASPDRACFARTRASLKHALLSRSAGGGVEAGAESGETFLQHHQLVADLAEADQKVAVGGRRVDEVAKGVSRDLAESHPQIAKALLQSYQLVNHDELMGVNKVLDAAELALEAFTCPSRQSGGMASM